ncbi:MAG: hypothetical protein IKD70_02750, partial [Eggerthellaceae bacterium]|nr:hypothetical protein [Eggerthellaceae bacterium]
VAFANLQELAEILDIHEKNPPLVQLSSRYYALSGEVHARTAEAASTLLRGCFQQMHDKAKNA